MKIKIENKWVGDGEKCFLVAEISANHLQKKNLAFKLIEEAKACGADAVKFQTYTPDTITLKSEKNFFKIKDTIWKGKTLYELYSEACTPLEWFPELADKARDEGIIFFSTAFDESAVDFLEKLKVPVHKIASFEINHIPLIKYIASKGKPVIVSTGVAQLEDIELAINTIRSEDNNKIIILKCTSSYPAPLNELNLKTIEDLRKRFGTLVGLSDHSMNSYVPVIALTLGACLIEKHFTLDRKLGGPDAKFSLEPKEFKQMVKSIREAEEAIGKISYELSEKVKEHRFLMRSIFAVKNIKRGEKFTKENIRVIRPFYGLHPKYYELILGKEAKTDIEKGTPITMKMVKL